MEGQAWRVTSSKVKLSLHFHKIVKIAESKLKKFTLFLTKNVGSNGLMQEGVCLVEPPSYVLETTPRLHPLLPSCELSPVE